MYIEIRKNPHKCGMCHKENINVKPLSKATEVEDNKFKTEFLNCYLCDDCVRKLENLDYKEVNITSVDGEIYCIKID